MDTSNPQSHANPKLVIDEVQRHLRAGVVAVNEINAGNCNRLFRFDLADDRSVLVKFYYKDERNRLQREFAALTFLTTEGFTNIPKPYFHDLERYFAVYSFEPGRTKSADQLTRIDLTDMMDFLIQLQAYNPEHVATPFPEAVFACQSLQDHIKNIRYRCDEFARALAAHQLSAQVEQFAKENNIIKRIAGLATLALKGISAPELSRTLSASQQRLSAVDFGPHNSLFAPNSPPRFVDFEYFGRDDPLKDIAGFIEHDQMRALARADRQFALEYYQNHSNLAAEALNKLPLILRLISIEWLAIHLFALTPARISLRKFSNANFNQHVYEKDQLNKMAARLTDFA